MQEMARGASDKRSAEQVELREVPISLTLPTMGDQVYQATCTLRGEVVPVPSSAAEMMDIIGPGVCDVVIEAAVRLLLHLVWDEISRSELQRAPVALFLAQALADHEDDLVADEDGDEGAVVKAEWYQFLRFTPLLDLLSQALCLPLLDEAGIVMLPGFNHLRRIVREFQDDVEQSEEEDEGDVKRLPPSRHDF